MKNFLLILSLSFALLSARGNKIVTIGAGSGAVSQTSQGTLLPGDVLKIAAGTYSGGTFSNINGVVIDETAASFTGMIYVSGLTNVIINGGTYKGASGYVVSGVLNGVRWYNHSQSGVTVPFVDASKTVATYNGTPATKLMLDCSIANLTSVSSSLIFMGSFALPPTFQNVCDSISVFNITITNSITNGNEILANSIYHLDAHDWTITGTSPNGSTDVGIIQIYGNSRVHNINRNGGYGYIQRIFNTGLDGVGESYLYNCIDLNSWQYGTIDTRVDPTAISGGSTPPYTTGGNIHILNNTAGNKAMTNAYTTSLAVIGDFTGYTCEVRNNLGFNNPPRVGSVPNSIITQNTVSALPDTSNNMYFTSAQITAVLVDQVNCYELPGAPTVNKGYPEPVVSTDIGGVTRPQGAGIDIGAREFAQAAAVIVNTPPVAVATGPGTDTVSHNVLLYGWLSKGTTAPIISYAWKWVSGPSIPFFTTPTQDSTTCTGLAPGVYSFSLTVTDSTGLTSTDTVSVTAVMPAACPPPVQCPQIPVTLQSVQIIGKHTDGTTTTQTIQ